MKYQKSIHRWQSNHSSPPIPRQGKIGSCCCPLKLDWCVLYIPSEILQLTQPADVQFFSWARYIWGYNKFNYPFYQWYIAQRTTRPRWNDSHEKSRKNRQQF